MLKQYVSMKYLFVVGQGTDFESELFQEFLGHIISMEGGKPFRMFLYKFNAEILKNQFPYLCLEGEIKKALALYPLIILK